MEESPQDPCCKLCRQSFGNVKTRDNHGYAKHGAPNTKWKATRAEMPGEIIQEAVTRMGRPKRTGEFSKSDQYGKLLKEKPPSEAERAAKDLPWLKMPRSARVCEKVADDCADLASRHRNDPELRDFYVGLRAHLIALGAMASKREKVAA